MSNDNLPEQKKPTVLQMVGSVLSAIFGVQNNHLYKRHFNPCFFCNLGFQIKMQKKNKMFTSKVL